MYEIMSSEDEEYVENLPFITDEAVRHIKEVGLGLPVMLHINFKFYFKGYSSVNGYRCFMNSKKIIGQRSFHLSDPKLLTNS